MKEIRGRPDMLIQTELNIRKRLKKLMLLLIADELEKITSQIVKLKLVEI